MPAKPEGSQLRRHFLALSSPVFAEPRQSVVSDSQLIRRLVFRFAHKRRFSPHTALHPTDNRLFLGDDCTRCDQLVITDLLAHKLIPVLECSLNLIVASLARRQSDNLAS